MSIVSARIARNISGARVLARVLARVVSIASELIPYVVLPPAEPPGLTLEVLEAAKDYLTQVAPSEVLAGVDSVTAVLTGLAAQALLDEVDV